jgi:UDP-N-acetylglucosamine 2-epimerase
MRSFVSKMKVVTIVGTRPELIKLSRIISALDEATEHILVHTGQNYDFELNEIFFRDLKIRKPNHFLNCTQGQPVQAIADILIKTDEILEKVKPHAALLYGDTNSCLAAIAIKKRKVPLFHLEAGNRCFDARVPEDLNRKIVDSISDINMPLTERARSYLLREGFPPDQIVKIGSCMSEVLEHFHEAISTSQALGDMKVKAQDYFLISLHREENVDDQGKLKTALNLLKWLREEYRAPVLISTHPRTLDRLKKLGEDLTSDSEIRFLKPFGFFDYIKLQQHASCVLSDSGTLMEEAYLLGFPAIHLRDSFERPEGMEAGTLSVVPLHSEFLHEAIRRSVRHVPPAFGRLPTDYMGHPTSQIVVNSIFSYVDMIRRRNWG